MKLLKLVPENTNIDFMRWRNLAMVVSILLTIAAIGVTVTRGLNLGIDFVGGQQVRVTFAEPVPIDKLRGEVAAMQVGEASIQQFDDNRVYEIRLPVPAGEESDSNAVVSKMRGELSTLYPDADIGSGQSVSGKVSKELGRDGSLAILFAMIGIAIYIWFRFEWQFGIGALVTLAHDMAVTLGFFALTQMTVDLNVVAAILTIVGYSINDTVIVYDRIRENLRKYRKMAIEPLLNLSLNETLARTVVTSFTMLLALGVLMLIGPDVIFGLAIAIFLGVVIGTYSSLFISTPILMWLKVDSDSFVREEVKDKEGQWTEGRP